jgi:hypothetical protein
MQGNFRRTCAGRPLWSAVGYGPNFLTAWIIFFAFLTFAEVRQNLGQKSKTCI